MVRKLGQAFLTVCLLTVGAVAVANAQVDSVSRIQANVPFAFTVGNTTLPAGSYEIKRVDDNATNVLEIRSLNGRTSVIFDTEPEQTQEDRPAGKTELVFNKFGDQYFLSQVWVAGSTSGSELPKSRMEKRLEGDGTSSERHSIVAVLKRLKP